MRIQILVWSYRCDQCGHRWQPRSEALPAVCPNCKRRNWDEKGLVTSDEKDMTTMRRHNDPQSAATGETLSPPDDAMQRLKEHAAQVSPEFKTAVKNMASHFQYENPIDDGDRQDLTIDTNHGLGLALISGYYSALMKGSANCINATRSLQINESPLLSR